MKKNALLILAVLFATLALLSIVQGVRNGCRYVDFHWESANLLLHGENPYAYYFAGRLHDGVIVDATQAPSSIILLAPWALLPRLTANKVWVFSNLLFAVGMLLIVWRVWFRDFRLEEKKLLFLVFALLVFLGTPCRNAIGNGQHVLFSLFFWLAAYWAAESRKPWIAGLLMSVGLMKYAATAPLCLIFLFRREWVSIAVCAAIHLMLSAGLGIYVGESPIVMICQSCQIGVRLALAKGLADPASLAAFLGFSHLQAWATAGYVLYGLLALAVAFFGKRDELLKLAALAVIANVMFYHRIYDFVTLVFPLLLVFRDWQKDFAAERFVRWTALLAVVWIFVGERLLASRIGAAEVPITFVSQHLLLLSLLASLVVSGPLEFDRCERGE